MLQDAEINVVEGSRFENDENMLLDMFLSDLDEVEDLIQLRTWVMARAAGKRQKKQVSNDTQLEVFPSSATVTVSGRWDRDWGEVTMSVEDFVEVCDTLIKRGGID